ncbi:purine and uridine phosphorylase [Penicillium waksmanii]|uniref:purine and uridine phosphorylase n=1 Tax=Penicillium waksmanii TaxID=69791 RepID=UPI0025491BF6|nr:purine and uridine phosphorylase [Penicillium waksmanii]KAJ5973626.1 purine and uridine phosphorylase [Penicillium waksmanii]
MWSRYVLKHRVDKYQQDTRCLLQQHRQSLAYMEVRKVKIDCSFLPNSRWGIIGQDPASPAWLLYLDVKISQPKDCYLANAKVEVTFQSLNLHDRSNTTRSQLGPVITDYFGPQKIGEKVIAQSFGSFVEHDVSYSLQHGSLMTPTKWLVEDAVSCGGLRLALILQHEMQPFSIAVQIDGKLQGTKNRSFRFARSIEQGHVNSLSRIVTPSGTSTFHLDDIASKLNDEMTTLNIKNNRNPSNPIQRTIGQSDTARQVSSNTERTHDDYTVAWICALPIEMAAAKAMLEEVHTDLPIHPSDTNQYILGRIGPHNIVLACLPHNVYGTTSAAVVATHILYAFRRIRIGLMVGIGGGVPSKKIDMRLGDVVVSSPTGHFGGVIQHDLGRNIGNRIQMTGSLNKPPPALLAAIARLRTEHLIADNKITHHIDKMLEKNPSMRSSYACLDSEQDQLFEAEYDHFGSAATCEACDPERKIERPPRSTSCPKIHYGLIASGNQVIRHGMTRDRLAEEFDVLCFEMEAAGLMDNFPCLVIRGICDYADSHKNKVWQGYAAATAAGYAKDLLSVVSVAQVYSTPIAATSAT